MPFVIVLYYNKHFYAFYYHLYNKPTCKAFATKASHGGPKRIPNMILLPFAAVGYSLVYLLLGGGFGGAVLIFIIAKMLGK